MKELLDESFLDVLVKLASAGTSGVCIFCLFSSMYMIVRMPNDAPIQRIDLVKSFMRYAAIFLIISASSTFGSLYLDYKTKAELKEQNANLATTLTTTNKQFEWVVRENERVLKSAKLAMQTIPEAPSTNRAFVAAQGIARAEIDQALETLATIKTQEIPVASRKGNETDGSNNLLAHIAIPAFVRVRQTSQDKSVLNNARQLSAAADQYFLENGVSTVSWENLVGVNNYVKAINTVANETYPRVYMRDTPITISAVAGVRTITYAP